MTKIDYIKEVEKNLDKKICDLEIVEGKMEDEAKINEANFTGVYALFSNDELVYIGSAYSKNHKIKDRLKQYLSEKDIGNTLATKIKEKGIENPIEEIKKIDFIAIQYDDLENTLIGKFKPIYNENGK